MRQCRTLSLKQKKEERAPRRPTSAASDGPPPDTRAGPILVGCDKQSNVHVWSRIASFPSLLIIAYITFIGDATRGIFFPVLLKQIQHLGGSSYDQGFLVATYSLGRLLSTTPFGYLCDTHQHRLPLVLANVILLCAAMLWANAYYFGLIALYIAQFGHGFGAGMSGITRSYVDIRRQSIAPTYLPSWQLCNMLGLQYLRCWDR